MIYIGLDVSTKTGIAVIEFTGKDLYETKVLMELSHPKLKGFVRCGHIAKSVLRVLTDYTPDVLMVEGYSFSGKFVSQIKIEVQVILNYFLWQENYVPYNLPPTSLKKFVTGKGNAKKDLVMKEVLKRWNIDTDNDNIADAAGLAMAGAAMKGMLTMPKPSMDALKNVKNLDVCN